MTIPHSPEAEPLILTAMLDDASQARFERERRLYFPPARNMIPAHVTLFHHLPGAEAPSIRQTLAEECRRLGPMPFTITGLRSLGRGTAYSLHMPGVAALRQALAALWQDWLTAQDRQPWHPHVTVQNKVTVEEARRVHAALLHTFTPGCGQVRGVSLWRYCDGPWTLLEHQLFSATLA